MKAPFLLALLITTLSLAAAEKEIRLRDLKPDSVEFKEIQQYLAATGRCRRLDFTIIQHVEGDLYLVEAHDINYAIEVKEGNRLTDGAVVGLWFEDTGKVFEYTSVLGAKASVKQLSGSTLPFGEFSATRLVERAKAGETFKVPGPFVTGKCPNCGGLGTIRPPRAGGNRLDCPKCEKGVAKIRSERVVKW